MKWIWNERTFWLGLVYMFIQLTCNTHTHTHCPTCHVILHALLPTLWPGFDVWRLRWAGMLEGRCSQPVWRCFTALAGGVLSQCVQYHNTSKFTAGFQHFPFIVLYCCCDTHWSRQIILFIIEHYPTQSIIWFISCPICLQQVTWTDIRSDRNEDVRFLCSLGKYIKKKEQKEKHFIREADDVWESWVWKKHLTFWCHRQTSCCNKKDGIKNLK